MPGLIQSERFEFLRNCSDYAPGHARRDRSGMLRDRPLKVLAYPGPAARKSNPYTWLLYSHMGRQVEVAEFNTRDALRDPCDIVHLHWPELPLNSRSCVGAFARVIKEIAFLRHLRSRGTKIVWTIHNLASHDRRHPRLEPWFWRQLVGVLDGFISLSNYGLNAAQERFPELKRLPGFVIPHGHYREGYPTDRLIDPRRELNLPLDARVVLFFGRIREYKNVPVLVRTFRAIQRTNTILLIAGSGSPHLLREIECAAEGDPRIRLEPGHISADRVQLYFRTANLVALPYLDILNSGTGLLALSFNRPVLMPAYGAIRELTASVGAEWVRTYVGDLTPRILEDAIIWAGSAERAADAPLDDLCWERISRQTLEAFEYLVSGRSLVASTCEGLPTTFRSAEHVVEI